jgi:hypothetical protein
MSTDQSHTAVPGPLVPLYRDATHRAVERLLSDPEAFKQPLAPQALRLALSGDHPPSFYGGSGGGVLPYSQVSLDSEAIQSVDVHAVFHPPTRQRTALSVSTPLKCVISAADWWKLLRLDPKTTHPRFGALVLSWELLGYDTRGVPFDVTLDIKTESKAGHVSFAQNWVEGRAAVAMPPPLETSERTGVFLPRNALSEDPAHRKLYMLNLAHLGSASVRALLTVDFDELMERLPSCRVDDRYNVTLGGTADLMPRNATAFVVAHCLGQTHPESDDPVGQQTSVSQEVIKALVPADALDTCVAHLRESCRQHEICLFRGSPLEFTLTPAGATLTQQWDTTQPAPRVSVRLTYVPVPCEYTRPDQ